MQRLLLNTSRLVIRTDDESKAQQVKDALTEAGGIVKYLESEPEDTPATLPDLPVYSSPSNAYSGMAFDQLTNKFSLRGCEAKSFIDLNCDKEVVYEVHVTYLPDQTLDRIANLYVLELYGELQAIEEYHRCGYVLEPYAASRAFQDKFGVSVELSNTETPDATPLGYDDSTSGNGMTATPLSFLLSVKQPESTFKFKRSRIFSSV